jgi:hypothetical protein
MPVIDEDGDLFGVVNAVDALAVALVVLVLAGGVVVLTGASGGADSGTLTQSVTVQTTVDVPTEVAALETGPVANEQVAAIERVERVGTAENASSGNATYELDVQLVVGTTEDGVTTFAGERLFIGRSVTLDLETVTVSGVVTAAREPERVESVPTPTPTPTPEPTTAAPSTKTPTRTATPPTQTTTPEPTTTRVVTVETTVDAGKVDTITEGPVMGRDIVAVHDRAVVSETETTTTLRLQVELEVVEEDGTVYFRGVAVEPGTRLRLDLGEVRIAGTVIAL